ncbi:MAG: penicillin-binding transpeptidase domain-containing protein [Cyclobacteriaceae bacterium]|jgi:penicillin-binding protein 2|nr:peptidoglycan glycosyltransferase [Flammeovirgaceae bacterium]
MNDARKHLLNVLVVLAGIVFIVKLFFIQVADNKYAQLADSNALLREVEYPVRGLIYDRHGELIVHNSPEYDLYVVVKDTHPFDSARFCHVFDMTREQLCLAFRELKMRKEYKPFKPTLFLKQLSNVDFAKIQDRLDELPGFFIQARTTRSYSTPSLANALGYVSEISKEQLARDSLKLYRQGDYIGQSGIEQFYEAELSGTRGVRFKLRNAKGIVQGSFNKGKFDTLSRPGLDLITGIDLKLQQYTELLMKGKAGSAVAIEPATGEILALVSGPSYDPGLLTGKDFSANFRLVSADTNKPLFNRALMAQYRPGSIFKIAQAMTALQQGVITPDTRIRCDRSVIACHGRHTNEDLRGAIANSCNPYFHQVFRRMIQKGKADDPFTDSHLGLAEWHAHIESFGFGKKLGVDLPNEKEGLIPTPRYYDKAYRSTAWKFSNIFSLSIGEGENLVVPLQMANFAATIANRGFFYTPHMVKAVGQDGKPLPQFLERHYTTIDSSFFNVAVDAMQEVVESGTASYRAKLQDIVICGKTGTVQNEPPLKDHAVFICFAPRENPKIAIAVYVEDAGFGGRAAASIASLMIEKYLLGETQRPLMEAYVLAGKFD